MTGIHTETSIPLQSTQAHRLLLPAFQRGGQISFTQQQKTPFVLARGSTLASIISKLPEWVCVFTCDRCRARAVVQDRKLSKHFSRPDGAYFLALFGDFDRPLCCTNTRNIQMNLLILIGGKRYKRERGLWGEERRTIVNDSFNGYGGFGGISTMLQCRCSAERLAVLET